MNALPQTGTSDLLERLSVHLEDDWINERFPAQSRGGRRRAFSSAQLLRVSLLVLLTPAHSFNLLLKLLAENRSWRKFAHLPNQRTLPDAKMLHQFRSRLDLIHLRQLNTRLLRPLVEQMESTRKTLAIMDATDLPAAVNTYKKTLPPATPL